MHQIGSLICRGYAADSEPHLLVNFCSCKFDTDTVPHDLLSLSQIKKMRNLQSEKLNDDIRMSPTLGKGAFAKPEQ